MQLSKARMLPNTSDPMSRQSSGDARRNSPHLNVLGYVHLTGPHVAQATFLHEPALVVVIGNPGGDAQPTGL